MTTIPPIADLAAADDATFAVSFTTWIDARVETLTNEIKARSAELDHLAELRARLAEWGRRQEASGADQPA